MVTRTAFEFNPDYAIPPGETLLELLETISMSQAELAERTGRPTKTINEIIKGKASITPETALQFERVLGVPASLWNNLERNYRETLARQEERRKLEKQLDWLKDIPVRDMAKLGWIKEREDAVEQLREVLNFFGVVSVSTWQNVWSDVLNGVELAFRRSQKYESDLGAVAAWLRKGQIEAQKIQCESFSASKVKTAIEKIRGITREAPEIFVREIKRLCADAGVAVVFVPELPKCRVSGATWWLKQDKVMIQLSLRYKTDDHLWFTFFHEVGHVLLDKKRDLFLEYDDRTNNQKDSEREQRANRFAMDSLIPPPRFKSFLKEANFSVDAIQAFADSLGIASGIIVGRLQFEGVIPYRHRLNHLKRRFRWA